jgi:hypothetical protein
MSRDTPDRRKDRLRRLEPFVGEWTVEAQPGGPQGQSTFEWVLGGAFLLQRTSIPVEGAPDSLSIIRVDEAAGSYQQHYFDSRGVVRLYDMTLTDGIWRLERHEPDFSPLPFHQRFIGTFSGDGNAIDGAWERSETGNDWVVDFPLSYRRAD